MFCPTCKSLMARSMSRGRPVDTCPKCDGGRVGTVQKPIAWWQKEDRGRADARTRDAAKAAAGARPHVPTGGGSARSRARSENAPRRDREPLPPPDKVQLSPGLDLFPFGTVRDGQRQFIADVASAAEGKRHLLAHAPTGLGKTVSTLAPLVAYALRHDKRVFFLTSKQSQHKIAVDTLKAIREKAGVPFTVSDVISKQDMCPRREARDLFPRRFAEFCREEMMKHRCDYWENANGTAVKQLKVRVHSVEEVVMTCTDAVVCPHNAALDLAAQAHVVICDYNYLFSDLREQMQERLRLDLADVLLVVDEAHNLPDRIRDHLSVELTASLLEDAAKEAREVRDEALARHLEIAAGVLETLGDKTRGGEWDDGEERPPASAGEKALSRGEWTDALNEALASRANSLLHTDYEGLATDVKLAAERFEKEEKAEAEALLEVSEFLSMWRIERRGLARILTTEPVTKIAYKVLDPAVLAKPVFDSVHASVVMSGTLHPMEMTRDVLGLDPARTTMREYASPFPRENRLVLVDASVTTGYKERTPTMFRDIGQRLAGIAAATPGNVAAFFPSYRILEDVRHHLEDALDGRKELIVEERGFDKSEKEALVGRMRRAEVQNALLVGVQGGSLSEGYDYEDNLLKAVVIVGLPFAAPTLEIEALIDYYDKKFGAGRGRPYAYTHPAFHRVMQAAGRCIRSPDDRGVIVLMDKRFAWGSYRASFPKDFDPRPSQDPVADVQRFWKTRA